MEEAIRRGRRVAILCIDWECQFAMTIAHIKEMFALYHEHVDLFWVQLPMTTWNGCSQHEPEWTAWDEAKKELWIREKDADAIRDPKFFPFYYPEMTFEEFTPLFAEWYGEGQLCANLVGLRTQESLNRFRTIARENKPRYKNMPWTTNATSHVWSAYPLYDWDTADDWTYFSKFKKCYNPLYDRMHQAGMTIHKMRIDEPFGDTQRQSLWLYQVIEPQTWSKMVARVAGANCGALYCGDGGNILGNRKISLPAGHAWKSFAEFLLHTMVPKTAEHYKNKIAVYLKWFDSRGYPLATGGIPDFADRNLESNGRVPTWRRWCKALLRNDYWCRTMGFSPTKSTAYSKYMDLMKRRREKWDLFREAKH
jgi:predicted phosphoadenosine phosphosulfate sulfurtransferase